MNIHSNLISTQISTSFYQEVSRSSSQNPITQDQASNKSIDESDFKSTEVVSAQRLEAAYQSPEQTATNILGFVYKDIQRLTEEGVDQGVIDQRLEVARDAIEKGYEEAKDILQHMGRLDQHLEAIDQGEALIKEGLTQIAQGELPQLLVQSEQAESTSQISVYQTSYQQEKQFAFEVLTQDGDRVKVSFVNQLEQQGFNAQGISFEGLSFSEAWNISVEGQLDKQEVQALDSLFADVQTLSAKFFDGDLGGALAEAMTLGFDSNELASMSLNLRQQTFSSVSNTYDTSDSLPTPRLRAQQNHLADYADAYIKAIDKLTDSKQPLDLFQQMIEALNTKEDISTMFQFNQGLDQFLFGRL